MFQESLPTFFLDFGVTVTAGSNSTLAIFDAPDNTVLGERVQSAEYSITYIAGALGSLAYHSAVTVSGTPNGQFDGNYQLRGNPVGVEDGQMQKAMLEALT